MQVKKGLLNLKKIIYEQQQNINQLVEISEEDAIKYGFINDSGNEPSEPENPDTPITPEEPDEPIVMTISGQWEGYLGKYYVDTNYVTHNSTKSSIVFYPNEKYDTRGYGCQLDWYNDGEYEKIFYTFTWEQDNDNNIIKLYYEDHPELNANIREYNLSKNHFTGYFNNSNIQFDLDATWKVYKWSDYATLGTGIAWNWQGQTVIPELSSDSYYFYNYNINQIDSQTVFIYCVNENESFSSNSQVLNNFIQYISQKLNKYTIDDDILTIYGPNVRIVLWIKGIDNPPSIYVINKDTNFGIDLYPPAMRYQENVDSTDINNLKTFIDYGKNYYPADSYKLIIWNNDLSNLINSFEQILSEKNTHTIYKKQNTDLLTKDLFELIEIYQFGRIREVLENNEYITVLSTSSIEGNWFMSMYYIKEININSQNIKINSNQNYSYNIAFCEELYIKGKLSENKSFGCDFNINYQTKTIDFDITNNDNIEEELDQNIINILQNTTHLTIDNKILCLIDDNENSIKLELLGQSQDEYYNNL